MSPVRHSDQRCAVRALLADHQRDMLAQIVGRAEGNDLGFLGGRYWQPGAGGDREMAGVLPFRQITGRNHLGLAAA
jgi:hypothetical protein